MKKDRNERLVCTMRRYIDTYERLKRMRSDLDMADLTMDEFTEFLKSGKDPQKDDESEGE